MNLAEWSSAADAATRALGQPAQGVRDHLIERMRDRAISLSDLNQLRLWVEPRILFFDSIPNDYRNTQARGCTCVTNWNP